MNKINKIQQYYGLGLLFALIVLGYSIYMVMSTSAVYVIECETEFKKYDIKTTNKTEFEEVYNICIEYYNSIRELNNPQILIPELNFSQLLNNS